MAQPTIVLVHDAFTDASSWGPVITQLHGSGAVVSAPANPLAGLAADARYLSTVVRRIGGPVLLAGHGYGGAVITNVAADLEFVTGLVYIAGFGLDQGESCDDVMRRFTATTLATAVRCATTELSVDIPYFHRTLAADLTADTAVVLAATQRPIAATATTDRSGSPAWTRLPSWYAITTRDEALNPAAQRFMAQRMAANQIEIDASHAAPLSTPTAVAALIRSAADH